jgi:hypothetical protein
MRRRLSQHASASDRRWCPPAAVDYTVKPGNQITGHEVAIYLVQALVSAVRVGLVDSLREAGGPIGVQG